jgi:4-hydroxy-tetrahydrodipicolinate reductase
MAEMRLIVTGAGGRMGRTLVKAIVDIKGFALVGVLEDARSPLHAWRFVKLPAANRTL